MNFVQQLEECLRDLASEARKNHPGVKEASERATLKLRHLKTSYVAAVRQAGNKGTEHPTTSLFQSSDMLHPFLLAANYPNASSRLLDVSFRAIRLLMEADAVVPTDGIHLVRVWMIQAQVGVSYFQKVYAKEIKSAEDQQAAVTEAEAPKPLNAPAASNSGGGWFSWATSSSTSVPPSSVSSNDSMNISSRPIKNAVSSSSGQSGQSSQSPKDMEKRALEILSSLLQLLEGLRRHPEVSNAELWSNAVALGCVWLHYLPSRHTVHQAAHSTVAQILSLFLETEKDPDLWALTWDDLLVLATGNIPKKGLQGAFSLCRPAGPTNSTAAVPPSPEFALELLALLSKDHHFPEKIIPKMMQMSMMLLQRVARMSVEKYMRTVQWTTVVLVSQVRKYPNECGELFVALLKAISLATEACRSHHDFEDGYFYSQDEALLHPLPVSELPSSAKESTRRRGLTTHILVSFFPSNALWKASFALEAVYSMLDKDVTRIFFNDTSTLSTLVEALSDFATIGTSCQDHTHQLVEFCQKERRSISSLQPTIFRKAEQVLVLGNASIAFGEDTGSRASEKYGVLSKPSPILGESLWISLQTVLQISEGLKGLDNQAALLEESFASTLAVLQHYLKRFSGSAEIVGLALLGYSSLADVCFPLEDTSMQRKAMLTSLCKLSLPAWGKHDASLQLQDHHIRSLLCLFRILHRHHDYVALEWEIILWTFEELSVLVVASPTLSEEAYHGALAVSAVFGRLAAFSTCLSEKSIIRMTESLTEIVQSIMEKRDLLKDSDILLPERTTTSDAVDKVPPDGSETISGKIVGIGVRAIYGASFNEAENVQNDPLPFVERTKSTFNEEYRRTFIDRLTGAKSSLQIAAIGRLPFALTLLADVAMANAFRYKQCGEAISNLLFELAASSPPVRSFVMETLVVLTVAHIGNGSGSSSQLIGSGKLVVEDPMQSQLLAVEHSDVTPDQTLAMQELSHVKILSPLCSSICSTKNAEMAEASLVTLTSILESTGHTLHGEVWILIIDTVSSLSGDPAQNPYRSSSEWSKCCLRAFRCLKLITDDFSEEVQEIAESCETTRTPLLDCCSAFGSSRHDINTSLTSIGLLWSIVDQDSGPRSLDNALSKLANLAADDRPEVRNAAINTLFSCIVGRGQTFTVSQWEFCFSHTLFPVYELVLSKTVVEDNRHSGDSQDASSRYLVSFHHSRDSTSKQWVTTQVVVLRGLIRVLGKFFVILLETTDLFITKTDDPPWFQDVWVHVLDFAFEAAGQNGGRDTFELCSAGIELLVACSQVSSKAGIQAALAPATVSTNMEVVNGALRNVRDPTPRNSPNGQRSRTVAVESTREALFLEAIEGLHSYQDFLDSNDKIDETSLQLIHKFCSGLSKLYECCRNDELAVCKQGLEPVIDDTLIQRFVNMVATCIRVATTDPRARFLNQAQRCALELLETIALNGSFGAFQLLVTLAGFSLFIRKDADSDSGETAAVESGDIFLDQVGFESSVVLSKAVLQNRVPLRCKISVLNEVLTMFLTKSASAKAHHRKAYYKRMIPILEEGLQAVASERRLKAVDDNADAQYLDTLWTKVFQCVTVMLTPIPIGKDMLKIPRVSEVLEVIEAVTKNKDDTQDTRLCRILSQGGSNAYEVALSLDEFASIAESDASRKSKKHKDEVMKLFTACYLKACSLNPIDRAIISLTDRILSFPTVSYEEERLPEARKEALLCICSTMKDTYGMEFLVVAVFSSLCKWLQSSIQEVRDAVAGVFAVVNVSEILQSAIERCKEIEGRAVDAEKQIEILASTVNRLQSANEELQREVAILQASSVL
jgi:hypothetical protein